MAYLAANSDEYFEIGYNHWDIELHDNLDIHRFTPIDQFKDIEYPPYILTKDDFQYILDYYKELNRSQFEEKIKNKSKDHSYLFSRIEFYFNNLIKEKKNISESGLFLLDYFKLVEMYNNLKDDDMIIITHG